MNSSAAQLQADSLIRSDRRDGKQYPFGPKKKTLTFCSKGKFQSSRQSHRWAMTLPGCTSSLVRAAHHFFVTFLAPLFAILTTRGLTATPCHPERSEGPMHSAVAGNRYTIPCSDHAKPDSAQQLKRFS